MGRQAAGRRIGRSADFSARKRCERFGMMRTAVCIVVMMLGIAACTDDAKMTVGAGQRVVENERAQGAAAQLTADGLSVSIQPATATIVDDLQAMISGGGGRVTYRWERNGQVIDGENGFVLPKGYFSKGDTVSVTATIEGVDVAASVNIANSPPKVISIPFSPPHIYRGVDITVAPVGFDADGDNVRFSCKWSVNNKEIQGDQPTLKGDLFKRGDQVRLTVIPSDNDGEGVPFVSQPIVIPNAAPRFVSKPPAEFKSETYQYDAIAEDPDGDALTYSITSAPRGMTIDSKSGTITWKIEKDQAGDHPIEVVAQDPEGLKAYLKYSLVITIP
jgi:hypothetical protein